MNDLRDKVVVGSLVIHLAALRKHITKSHYFLRYEPKSESLTLSANHGSGGQVLLEIRNVSYESAEKLAEGLGLKGDDGEVPLMWSKWNPVLRLEQDSSEEAESLRVEMLRLGIPHTVCRSTGTFSLQWHQFIYGSPSYTFPQILEVIRGIAEQYKDNLSTTP